MNTAVAEKPMPTAANAPAMHLVVNRAELLRALGYASAIVERRNTIPVLSNVLLEAEGQELRITATDLNLQIALTVPCQVETEGATTVQAALLHGIIREFGDGAQVELSMADSRLQVNSGRSRYKLQTLRRDDFPVFQPKEALASFSLPALDLLGSIARVSYAQDVDTVVRPAFCGVNIETKDGALVFVATDGKRIAWAELPAPEEVEIASAILPTKLVSTITKLLDGQDGDVQLTLEEKRVILEIGDTVLIGKLVEGTYPPWRRIVPTGEGRRLKIEADVLGTAVRRAALVANERTRAVKFELTADKLTITCTSPNQDVAVEETPCAWAEDDFSLGFNSRFLLDTLSASGAKNVLIDFYGGPSPVALFTNPDDDSAHWLLAPMYA